MFGNKKDKYPHIERDYSSGVARYTTKKSDVEKNLQDQSNPDNAAAIATLKEALRKEVDARAAQRRACFRQTKDPKKNNLVVRGDALKAMNYDTKQTTNNIDRIIRQLAAFGVKAEQSKSGKVSFKNVNEGGEPKMYDVRQLKQMKLETFQESAAGKITKEASDYLLKYFDVMIEAAKGDDINTLVTDYVAACKSGDEDKKASLKEKITAAGECKKAKKELEELKEKLSDDEKKFVEELDAEICGDGEGGEETPAAEGNGDEPVQESGDEAPAADAGNAKKTADDASKSVEELGKKIKDGADKAGTDNKEAFEQLLGAASESAITDVGKDAILEYVTESVASGDMDADVAVYLTSLIGQ